MVCQESRSYLLLGLVASEPLQGCLIPTRKLRSNAQCGLKDGHGGRVERVVQMRAARVDAAVPTVVQEHARESEDGLKKLSVAVHVEAMASECFLIPMRPLPAVFDRGTLAQQKIAREVLRLRAFVETVVSNETLEDVVEPVQERDPVEKIASRERPFRREGLEGLGKKR